MVAAGTINDPFDIKTAFSRNYKYVISPGDTVYLRGGIYTPGDLECFLVGEAENPIAIRNYPGEIAKIDAALVISAPYTTWMSEDYGLHVVGTSEVRETDTPGSAIPSDMPGHGGISIAAPGVKLINIVIHNVLNNAINWFNMPGEIYGCVIYHNGRIAPDRWHGPGIYTHYDGATVNTIKNCVIVDSFRYGLQLVSAGSNEVWNYDIEDTVVIGSGVTLSSQAEYPAVDNVVFTRLHTYNCRPFFGVSYGNQGNAVVLQDSIINFRRAFDAYNLDDLHVVDNRFSGASYDITNCPDAVVLGNVWGSLSGTDINFVPNAHAPNWATLTAHLWDGGETVNVDISAWASNGDTVRVHNVLLLREEYITRTVSEGSITVPLAGWTTPPPLGLAGIITNAYPGDFGCWLLEKI